MDLGIILETNDPECVWNAFRLANTALESDHTVETVLLGDGIGAILVGLAMEFASAEAAFYPTALLTFASGAVVHVWVNESHPEFGTHEPPAPATEHPAGAFAGLAYRPPGLRRSTV